MSRIRLAGGIFFCSASTLMLQLALSRLFSAVFFNNYAFLIVSFALLGYATAGVFLALTSHQYDYHLATMVPVIAPSFIGGVLFIVYLIRHVPLNLMALNTEPHQWLWLAVYYVAVTFPFFLLGLIVAQLFTEWTKFANQLYFWDLLGAATGSLLLFLVIRPLMGVGSFLLAAILGLLGMYLLSPNRSARLGLLGILLMGGLLVAEGEHAFELRPIVQKRDFRPQWIEYTEWGPLTRIDIQKFYNNFKILWIDMGTNQSFMYPWKTEPMDERPLPPPRFTLPYHLKFGSPPENVLIVGPAGGYEVAMALAYGAGHVVGVEMDPTIVRLVKGPYSEFLNNLYHHPRVRLLNDEGRSYIRRDKSRYGVIQQIYNATPIAVMSGALNLSETYLITREAFQEYWDHLTDNGILAIHRWGALRLMTQAYDLLRRNGVEDPFRHIAVVQEESWLAQSFILKKSPLTDTEIKDIIDYAHRRKGKILFVPGGSPNRSLFSQFARASNPDDFIANLYRKAQLDIRPVTDDRPFFNQFIPLWRFHVKATEIDPDTTAHLVKNTRSTGYTLGGLLVFGLLIGGVFILWPLVRLNRRGISRPAGRQAIMYFAGLGFGFIAIEVCLFQWLVLFLGAPVYSITFVLVSLLLQAGVGSFLIGQVHRAPLDLVRWIIPVLWIATLFTLFMLRRGLNAFIGLDFTGRLMVAFLAILPMAVLMGMLFPLGLRWAKREDPALVAWGWGINGYTTVLGSVLAVILAMTAGFTMVFLSAMGWYGLTWIAALRTAHQKH